MKVVRLMLCDDFDRNFRTEDVYLGCMFSRNGRIDREIERRLYTGYKFNVLWVNLHLK